MKVFTLSLLLAFSSAAVAEETVKISIKDVVGHVSNSNFKVYENALKVYQAKTNIEKARADLLPRLNIWSIAKIILDPMSITDRLPEMAPFLVPANWFRLEETKLLYLAEKEGYRALWGNELHAAKVMFNQVQFDSNLLQYVSASKEELSNILVILKTREELGGAPAGPARDMEIRILGLLEDERNLQVLIEEEHNALTYALGLKLETPVELIPTVLPDFKKFRPIDYKKHEFRMLANSPERRQFGHFLSVVAQIKNEVQYSFLGGSSISRGVAGGIFDSLPTPDGLGFGQGPAMKIVEAQKQIILTQRMGVEETLKRQLKNLSYSFNLDLSLYDSFLRRIALSRESKENLLMRIQLGENVSMLELAETSKNVIQAESSLYALQFRIINSVDRLDRLVYENDYAMNPPLIESLK